MPPLFFYFIFDINDVNDIILAFYISIEPTFYIRYRKIILLHFSYGHQICMKKCVSLYVLIICNYYYWISRCEIIIQALCYNKLLSCVIIKENWACCVRKFCLVFHVSKRIEGLCNLRTHEPCPDFVLGLLNHLI